MVNFKIKIADIVLEINAFNESTKKYCRDFLSEEKSDYSITMTEKYFVFKPKMSRYLTAHFL